MRSVLIVDDDIMFCEMLKGYLAHNGIAADSCYDGERSLEEMARQSYDLMLLDVMLPGIDGFEVLRRLREFSAVCVLLLTARGESADRVHGLRLGADDYLPKPFDLEELMARIDAILRRSGERPFVPSPAKSRTQLQRAGLTVDMVRHSVSYKDSLIDLTDIEFGLLTAFLQSPGVVLTREKLVTDVFQRPFHPLDRSLDMYVSRLRRKLRQTTPLGNHIKTIRSLGYLFSTVDSEQGTN